MPTNNLAESCITAERGALVFLAPPPSLRRLGSRVQIVDVFSLQIATGYTRDPQGKLLLEAQPSLGAGRCWTLAKAAQLIRNDIRPHRWVALELNKRAWGLFWAGGGIQRCREVLAERSSEAETGSALVPATSEALLRLMLDLEHQGPDAISIPRRPSSPASPTVGPWTGPGLWLVVAWTSLGWIVVLGITVAGFLGALERQDRKLELLLQPTAPDSSSAPHHRAGP